MHEIPPVYQVVIKEMTSKQTLISTVHVGELAPLLREGSMLAKVAECDKQTFWRASPIKRGANEYV